MSGINALVRRLKRLGSEQVRERVASKVRDAAHAECLRGFIEKRDPYGVPWAPRRLPRGWAALAFPDDGHPLLDKTGRMIGSLRSLASSRGVRMSMNGPAKYHQAGAVHPARTVISTGMTFREFKMPARMLFPDPNRGLGLWSDPVRRAAVEGVRELMK